MAIGDVILLAKIVKSQILRRLRQTSSLTVMSVEEEVASKFALTVHFLMFCLSIL